MTKQNKSETVTIEPAARGEIAPGLYLVKIHGYGGNLRATIPPAVKGKAKLHHGTYAGVMLVGECVVIAALSHLDSAGALEEMREKFLKAVDAFIDPRVAK